MGSKKWYKSKTVWLNSGLVVLGLAILELPELQDYIQSLPFTTQVVAMVIYGALGNALRFITDKRLEL